MPTHDLSCLPEIDGPANSRALSQSPKLSSAVQPNRVDYATIPFLESDRPNEPRAGDACGDKAMAGCVGPALLSSRTTERPRSDVSLLRCGGSVVGAGRGCSLSSPAGERRSAVRVGHDEIDPLGVDFADGHGIAEDYVRHIGATAFADPNARWRRAQITPAQAARLRRLGVTAPDGATKGQASDLIALHEGARRLKQLPAA